MKIKAKVTVDVVTEHKSTDGSKYAEEVSMRPVYSEDPASENYSYSQATPSGSVNLYITNPGAFGAFIQGKEYIVDFTPAE